LAGKRDIAIAIPATTGFSENVVVAETGFQMLEVLLFCDRDSLTSFNKNNHVDFSGGKR